MSRSRALKIGLMVLLAGAAGLSVQAADPAAAAGNNRARRLVAEIRAELGGVEDQIRNAPYLTALEAGQVSRANLKAFVGEQYHISKSDLRSLARLVSRFGGTPEGDFFQSIQDGEILARRLLLEFAAALGLDEDDLEAYEPRPRAQTYPSYFTWLSIHGSEADMATAILINFPVFGENTGRMGVALRNRYGFTAEQTAYFDFLAVLPPDFEDQALAVIEKGLRNCAEPRIIKRSSRLLQAYEKDFWDAVAEN